MMPFAISDLPGRARARVRARPIVRRVVRSVLLLTGAASASCGAPTSPSSVDMRFEITGETRTPTTDSGDATYASDAANAAAGAGAIVVLGRMVLPSHCFVLTPSVARVGTVLDIVISAHDSGTASCTTWMVARSYSLRLGSLEHGTYHVRVVHQLTGLAVEASAAVLVKDVPVE